MGDNQKDFYEKPFTPLDKMSKEEMSEELLQWRNLWTWQDADVAYWLTKVGQPIRVTLRNSQTFKGTLGSVQYEPKVIGVFLTERLFDYSRGEATYETKEALVKISDLVSYEFIHAEEVVAESFSPTSPPVEDEPSEVELIGKEE